jgi:hypothetical protein
MKHLLYYSALLLFFSFSISCKKEKIIVTTIPPIVVEEPLIALPSSWVKNDVLSKDLPKSAAVYEHKIALDGTSPFRAIAFVCNMNDTTLEFKTAMDTKKLTPTQWQTNETTGKTLALLNGGFFDLTNGQSYSLVVQQGKMLSSNVKVLTRTFNGVATSYFPTRAAFGISNKKMSCEWIYNVVGIENYTYTEPSPNFINYTPQAKPSQTFPTGATLWTPQVAIGGSPMLIKNNNIKITDSEEMIEVNNKSGRSRSALGYTAKNRLILLVIEKNTTSGNVGASLVETAQLLKDMGCIEAINLDGGGSTCLLVNNGLVTNIPEGNTQRAVTSVVMIKTK